MKKSNFIEKILLPKNGLIVFLIVIAIVYMIIPFSIVLATSNEKKFGLLAMLTLVSIFAMLLGNNISIMDRLFYSSSKRLHVSANGFVKCVWLFFLIFIVVTMVSASAIPIISATSGADAELVSQQRGDFLKGREGIGIALLYLSTFMSTFVPYTIILLYEKSSKYRHLALMIFVLYGVSFMVKALFLYAILPVLVFLAIRGRLKFKIFIYIFLFIITLLIGLTIISLNGETGAVNEADFFTAKYTPSDSLSYFIWRSFGVPIFTAVDTLVVHREQFSGQPLMGATSSLISSLFGIERINLERFVFQHQFGSWNDTANANAVFITDAFVNFGWIGVIVFSMIVGQIFRWFRLSPDVAFRAQWINFAFIIFSASLIGTLLSNWWMVMFFNAFLIKVGSNAK